MKLPLRNVIVRWLSRHPGVLMFGAVLYLLSPFDLLPEALTGLIGYLDDVLALAVAFYLARRFAPGSSPPARADRVRRDPYEVLGVSRGASQEEVRQAYRRMMADYHPDKVAHLGPDLRKLAEAKATAINEAYRALTSRD